MQANHKDAEIILKLYELRTEATMRKARAWMMSGFWPKNADEMNAVVVAFGTEHNGYFRQVLSFWEMAASFALSGAIDERLFCDSAGEMFFMYAKFGEFIPAVRQITGNVLFMAKMEKLITRSPEHRERVEMMKKGVMRLAAVAMAK